MELIETFWNVKGKIDLNRITGQGELIETFWNVKTESVQEYPAVILELIETFWNVKYPVGGMLLTDGAN